MCGRQTSSPPEMVSTPKMGFCAPTLLRSAPWFRDGASSDCGEIFADAIMLADTVTRSAVTKNAVVRSLPILAVSRLPEILVQTGATYKCERSHIERLIAGKLSTAAAPRLSNNSAFPENSAALDENPATA